MRLLSVALLASALVGGVYVGRDRQDQRQVAADAAAYDAQLAADHVLAQRAASADAAASRQRDAQVQIARNTLTQARTSLAKAKRAAEVAKRKQAAAAKAAESTTSGPTKPYDGPIPGSCLGYAGNRAIGCAVLVSQGYDMRQMFCLNKLFNRESGWNPHASNGGSGAYGIPQALPGNKMASSGDDWRDSVATQVKWGLGYIKGRYGNPCGAWAHSENFGWY